MTDVFAIIIGLRSISSNLSPFIGVWERTRPRQYVLLTFPMLLSSHLELDTVVCLRMV